MRLHPEYKLGFSYQSIKCALFYLDLIDKPSGYEDRRFMEMAREHLEKAMKVINADTEAEIIVAIGGRDHV